MTTAGYKDHDNSDLVAAAEIGSWACFPSNDGCNMASA